jgi:hypothetical protein
VATAQLDVPSRGKGMEVALRSAVYTTHLAIVGSSLSDREESPGRAETHCQKGYILVWARQALRQSHRREGGPDSQRAVRPFAQELTSKGIGIVAAQGREVQCSFCDSRRI